MSLDSFGRILISMVATPHALAGAFVSRFVRSPRAALGAGVISHLVLDRIPHSDYRLTNRKALFADLTATSALGVALARRDRLAAAGAFGGVLPDLIMVAERRTGLRVTLPLHRANHTSIRPPVLLGALIQLITAWVLLTRLHRRLMRRRSGPALRASSTTTAAPSSQAQRDPDGRRLEFTYDDRSVYWR